jgi:hypothetical protein
MSKKPLLPVRDVTQQSQQPTEWEHCVCML